MSDWYEALNAWRRREISADEAIRAAEVGDIWELWELALGAGIDIKTADRDHVAAVVRGKRQIERGESVEMIDLIAEVDLIVHGITEDEIRHRLRLKWIPWREGFDLKDIDDYERYLSMSYPEQLAAAKDLSSEDYELYETLTISSVSYHDPVDGGGVTDEKVSRYPERYR